MHERRQRREALPRHGEARGERAVGQRTTWRVHNSEKPYFLAALGAAAGLPQGVDLAAVAAGAARARVGSKPWLLALRGGLAAQLRFFEGPWRELWQRQPREALDEGWLQELSFFNLESAQGRVNSIIIFVC